MVKKPYSEIMQYEPVFSPKLSEAIANYFKHNSRPWLTEYRYTEAFQQQIAALLGVKHCICTTSGTSALILAIKALALPSVTVSALSMQATWNAPIFVGSKCDAPKDINKYGLSNGYVDIYTSLNGRSDTGYFSVQDACQSLFSKVKGDFIGTDGGVGCFSLSPHKIISTGQGGFCVTNDDALALEMKDIRDNNKYSNEKGGFNSKFTDIQAVIGLCELEEVPFRIKKKKEIYRRYKKHLSKYMIEYNDPGWVPWMVDIYIDNREDTVFSLMDYGIVTREMYRPFNNLHPMANKLSKRGLFPPSSLNLKNEVIDFICEKVLEIVEDKKI